ncbi:MAG: DUF922 domain-containing protein [Hyphomicrobiales bacterium]|nr:DUF922 domain-containing protein [Hyphomicrobiales bacterium]
MSGRAGPILALAIASVLAGMSPSGAEVVTTTEMKTYTVSGTTPLTILHSMLKRGRQIGHAGSMAITYARLSFKADISGGDDCRVRSNRVTASFTISLPQHASETTLPASTRKAFRAFREYAKAHELRHREIYLGCARRADRAILKLRAAGNCSAVARSAKQLWKAEMDRCKAAHATFDKRESARSTKVPLLREAMAAFSAQMTTRAQSAETQVGHAGGGGRRIEGIGR